MAGWSSMAWKCPAASAGGKRQRLRCIAMVRQGSGCGFRRCPAIRPAWPFRRYPAGKMRGWRRRHQGRLGQCRAIHPSPATRVRMRATSVRLRQVGLNGFHLRQIATADGFGQPTSFAPPTRKASAGRHAAARTPPHSSPRHGRPQWRWSGHIWHGSRQSGVQSARHHLFDGKGQRLGGRQQARHFDKLFRRVPATADRTDAAKRRAAHRCGIA